MPNGRCRLDGGKSTGAPIITGKYSKLTGKLLESFERSLADQNLLSIRHDVAVIEALQIERLPRLMDLEAQAELWKAAQQHFDDLAQAVSAKDPEQLKLSLALLGNILNNSVGAVKAEEEFIVLAEKKSRLQQNEIKKLTMLQDYADSRSVMARMALLYQAVVNNVKDPDTLRRIAIEFDRSGNAGSSHQVIEAS